MACRCWRVWCLPVSARSSASRSNRRSLRYPRQNKRRAGPGTRSRPAVRHQRGPARRPLVGRRRRSTPSIAFSRKGARSAGLRRLIRGPESFESGSLAGPRVGPPMRGSRVRAAAVAAQTGRCHSGDAPAAPSGGRGVVDEMPVRQRRRVCVSAVASRPERGSSSRLSPDPPNPWVRGSRWLSQGR